jgi:SRSO17 transposase
MSRRPADPVPVPLETYCQQFDACFRTVNQRNAFRRYLTGLLLPAERNKTLTALASAEPVTGAQRPGVQRLQWFVSESSWQPAALNRRRLELLQADVRLAPDPTGVLVIDEHGDRKRGTQTAHVGKQYVGNLGKVEQAVVSVSSLWADEDCYYPLDVVPYTPAHHFARGKADPAFRTKPQLALALVQQAVAAGIAFRAVVADSCYGEDHGFTAGLRAAQVDYVLALKPSHGWWHRAGDVGALWEAAEQAGWQGPAQPGHWVPVARCFRDGHRETWWVAELVAGPYGPDRPQRAVVATTDPTTLPGRSTWYLATTLQDATLAEIVRLYGLRNWVEQSYLQVKHHLGWSQYQVRSDLAIRRHWALVCCAFSFCWLAAPGLVLDGSPPETVSPEAPASPAETASAGRGENTAPAPLARGPAAGAQLADPVDLAQTMVAGVVGRSTPTAPAGPARRPRPGLSAAVL